MKGRIPLFVLLASALTFLASLFLPWRDATASPFSNTAQGLLNQFASDGRSFNGWLAISGDVTVLLVVAIVLATVTASRGQQIATRLPIGGLGVALAYFAVAVAGEVHTLSREFSEGSQDTRRLLTPARPTASISGLRAPESPRQRARLARERDPSAARG
jgi:hypothetical protein